MDELNETPIVAESASKAPRQITLVTRKSPLAMAQTELVKAHLESVLPDCEVRIQKMVTTGDKKTKWSLEKKGGKGLFTKELEDALLAGEGDIAVHSAKDLPTEMPEGLALAGFMPREEVNDVMVIREGVKQPVFIATSSPRRRAQAKMLYPKAVWSEIRGNVDTRLKKIVNEQADATVLAAAGLNRLGIAEWPGIRFEKLPIDQMVPAVGQGAIALQTRSGDVDTFCKLFDDKTRISVEIERKFLAALGGGCHTAFAAHYHGETLTVFHEDTGINHFSIQAELSQEKLDETIEGIVKQVKICESEVEGSARGEAAEE